MKYIIPRHHNQKLVSPPFEELDSTTESNRQLMAGYRFSIGGMSFRDFRRKAMEEVLRVPRDRPVVLAGHQPGIHHMGVVEKLRLLQMLSENNFASHIALDTDEIEALSVRIPLKKDSRRETREFYLYRSAIPRAIFTIPAPEKKTLDQTFTEIKRCLESTGSKTITKSFERFREIHNEVYDSGFDLGSLLSSYQRRFLHLGGIHESRMSSICNTESWRAFVRFITENIDKFSSIYNDCLDKFREERKIKTTYSPFPNLLRSGERMELPFWAVGKGGLRSGPFILRDGKLENASGESIEGSLLIPRAITFTIFARLFLSDLFIHGAGGGNYDRATDAIIREYFGIEPPAYCVTSTTVYPELPMDREIDLKIQKLKQELREMKQHPERYVSPSSPLKREKMAIITNVRGRLDRESHLRIKEINEELRGEIADLSRKAEKKLRQLEKVEEGERPWRRRDYPYFLLIRDTLCYDLRCKEL